MRMRHSLLWIILLCLPIIFLGLLLFLLKDSVLSLDWSQLKVSDLVNLGALAIGFLGAFVAIGSLFVAVTQLQQATKDGEEQRKSLDASRNQLQAVIDVATAQQEILKRNLEISQAQQELLSKSLETSKVQQKIQAQSLDTSKAQLGLLEEQRKREEERQARRPIAEVALQTNDGAKPLIELEKLPQIDFPLEKDKKWARLVFYVLNKGNVEISRPLVRLVTSPDTVHVDRADIRIAERMNHNTLQFSGPTLGDIEPEEIAGGSTMFSVDITVPDSVDVFDLDFAITGKNLRRRDHILHFKILRPSS